MTLRGTPVEMRDVSSVLSETLRTADNYRSMSHELLVEQCNTGAACHKITAERPDNIVNVIWPLWIERAG